MPDTSVKWDDGKGRTIFRKSSEEKPDTIDLVLKSDWREATNPGEYGWDKIESLGVSLDVVILNCPFCGFSTPVPWMAKVIRREPLTLEESLNCTRCETTFYVILGRAIRSWGRLDVIPLSGKAE